MIVAVDRATGDRLLTAEEAANLRAIETRSWHRGVIAGRYPQADGHVGRTPVWLESTVRRLGKSTG